MQVKRMLNQSVKKVSAWMALATTASLLLASVSFAEVVEVKTLKMRFIPEEVTINVGDTVRWVNIEKRQYHSVWFESLGEPEGEYFFPEESVEKRFDRPGDFDYRCGPHPKMIGKVHVRPMNAKQSVSEVRAKELAYLVKQDCGSCHGMLFKGGLGPALLPTDIESYTVADLEAVILHGRPGTPMPPWKDILSEADANWIAKALKSGEMIDAN